MTKPSRILRKSNELGDKLEWEKWQDEIPRLTPKRNWEIKALPPFQGAVIRYEIADKYTGKTVSVYLDCYNVLGIYNDEDGNPKPYWEVYAIGEHAGTMRFDMENVESLVDTIEDEFKRELSVVDKIRRRFSWLTN